MTDRAFLMWIHERLVKVHGESGLVDYMHKLRAVIRATPKSRTSRNVGEGCNSLEELKCELAEEEK